MKENMLLINSRKIERESLITGKYVLYLLDQGLTLGLLDRSSVESIQAEIMLLLKNLILRYTGGNSTSVTVEKAELILNSICYSMDAYLSSFRSKKDAIHALKSENIKDIYNQGIAMVSSCISETKLLYKKVYHEKLNIPHIAYNTSIEAIPDFFRNYGIVFDANNTMVDIDYPLLFDDTNMKGVFYVRHYLQNLSIENEFCSNFSEGYIIKALTNYGNMYGIDYKVSLINIFEVLLNGSIFSVMSGDFGTQLIISELQFKHLSDLLNSLKSKDIRNFVIESMEKLIKDLSIDNNRLINYIYGYTDIITPRIINALENNSLENMVIVEVDEHFQHSGVLFHSGERISDSSFRKIIDKIIKCSNAKDKVNIIKSSINSLEDFVDVLNSDCLYGQEYLELFSSLSDIELSVLSKTLFYEEMREGTYDLAEVYEDFMEMEWQKQYIKFLKNLYNQ